MLKRKFASTQQCISTTVGQDILQVVFIAVGNSDFNTLRNFSICSKFCLRLFRAESVWKAILDHRYPRFTSSFSFVMNPDIRMPVLKQSKKIETANALSFYESAKLLISGMDLYCHKATSQRSKRFEKSTPTGRNPHGFYIRLTKQGKIQDIVTIYLHTNSGYFYCLRSETDSKEWKERLKKVEKLRQWARHPHQEEEEEYLCPEWLELLQENDYHYIDHFLEGSGISQTKQVLPLILHGKIETMSSFVTFNLKF